MTTSASGGDRHDRRLFGVFDDFRVPLHEQAAWPARDPVRTAVTVFSDALQMLHEARQVIELAPEAIHILHGIFEPDASRTCTPASAERVV